MLDPVRDGTHTTISGVALETELALWVDGAVTLRLQGSLLWTHFGISGPVVLDVSRHLLRARLEGRRAELTAGFVPGKSFTAVRRRLDRRGAGTATRVHGVGAGAAGPASMADAMLTKVAVDPAAPLAHLGREERRRLTRALTDGRCRSSIPAATPTRKRRQVASTCAKCTRGRWSPACARDLYVVGEVLDVDGRLGGFNFQWAWSSAFAAGQAIANR